MSLKTRFADTKLRFQFRLQLIKLPKEVLYIFSQEIDREIAYRERKGDKR